MSQLSLKELCKKAGITCSKCLDTGKLWKNRGAFAHLDGRGFFDIIRCNSCSDGGWLNCSQTDKIYVSDICIFHKDDNNEATRISIVNKIYNKIQENEKRIKEQLEIEHLKKLQQEREEQKQLEDEKIRQQEIKNDQERKQKESVEQQMNDGSDQPLYGESIDDSFSTITEHIHIQGELGKLIDKVSTAIQAYGGDLLSLADVVKNIKIDLDMKSEDEKIEKTKCCQSTKKDGFPVYLFLKIQIHNESSSCTLLEWCGCSNIVSKITVKYMVLFPKNKVAKKECDDGVSAITGVKLDGIIAFLKQ